MDINTLIYGFPAVLIIIGLTQVAKQYIENRWMPILAILFGVILTSLVNYRAWTPEALVTGIVLGLVASGCWDMGKKTCLGK